jgi:hypothetical protein
MAGGKRRPSGTGRAIDWVWRGSIGRMWGAGGFLPWRARRPGGESEFEHIEGVGHARAPGTEHPEPFPDFRDPGERPRE